ncbi:MAG: putative nucleotidyltransferase [Paenibacillaceae bacterium]|jgi:CBS domain-containing protein|nr:putative nucleotidyltransferase [Paenibacillaceae bacterium]
MSGLHLYCTKQIADCVTVEQLRAIRDCAFSGSDSNFLLEDPLEWNRQNNEMHDQLIRRTIQLSEMKLADQGKGTPPVPYVFLLFGSGGRSEQTLWSDQDNGLVYENIGTDRERGRVEQYFNDLASLIFHNLVHLGYPPCPGNVVADNGRWRIPLSAWEAMITRWISTPDWESMRYALMISDMRWIHGDANLFNRVHRVFRNAIRDNPQVLIPMLKNTLHHKVSLGVFGQLLRERYGEFAGSVDVKYGMYIPFVNGIRLLSLRSGLFTNSTLDRLMLLEHTGELPGDLDPIKLRHTFAALLKFRALTPCEKTNSGVYATTGKLPAEMLTKERVREIKHCLITGNSLQRWVEKSVNRR